MRKQSEHQVSTMEQGRLRWDNPRPIWQDQKPWRVPMNSKGQEGSPTELEPHSAKMLAGVFSPVIWDWVGDNWTVGTHSGITWCNLDSDLYYGPSLLNNGHGQGRKRIRAQNISRTMPPRQRGFQLIFGEENNSLRSMVLQHTKEEDIYRDASFVFFFLLF